MNFVPDDIIIKTTKEIFNKQDIKLTNIVLHEAYTTITGKTKYTKTEMDLIMLLFQLWNKQGTITLESSITTTTKQLNELLGVARTVSSTLTNLKKYSVHEKKVFELDENGKQIAVGRKNGKTIYAKTFETVIPERELFRITAKDDFSRNDEGVIIGRETFYIIKPAPLLINAFKELGLVKEEVKKEKINYKRANSYRGGGIKRNNK